MPNGTCERKKIAICSLWGKKWTLYLAKPIKLLNYSLHLPVISFVAIFSPWAMGPSQPFFTQTTDVAMDTNTNTNTNSCFSHFSQMFRNWDFIHRRRYKWDLSPSSSCFWIYSWLIHVCLITFLQIYTNFHFSNEFSNFLLPLTLNVEDEGTI